MMNEPLKDRANSNDGSDSDSQSSLTIYSWDVNDVCRWLNIQGYQHLEDVFKEHDIDGVVLLTLTLQELKEDLQIQSLGIRKRLYFDIQSLIQSQEDEDIEEIDSDEKQKHSSSSKEVKVSEMECVHNGGIRGVQRLLPKSTFSRAIIPEYFRQTSEGGRPNYFLGLRINNHNFISMVEQLQKEAVSRYPGLSAWVTPPVKLHLTLFVMEIDEENEIPKVQKLLHECQDVLNEFYPPGHPPKLEFNQTHHFDRRVFYAAPQDGPAKSKLASFAYTIHKRFKENEIRVNRFDFVPHATIFKAPRRRRKIRRIKSIPAELINEYAEYSFGHGSFEGVDLTKMSATDAEGYYQVLSQVAFNSNIDSGYHMRSEKDNNNVTTEKLVEE
eukprot:gb/GECH01013570.1/.p1 GENE.gb/GECH01013570.1/~~gb/GECH01013570.1/.p1  ORF type:complete len:384 (+),score=119.93 gb/GECH01013570.1/:1-1152(+)